MDHFGRSSKEGPSNVDQFDPFPIIGSYFEEYGPVRNQFDAYNHLITTLLPKIVSESSSIKIHIPQQDLFYRVSFENTYIDKALDKKNDIIYPNDARLRDLTYECQVFVDIREEWLDTKGNLVSFNIHKKKLLLKLPVMVRSICCNLHSLTENERVGVGECPLDPGGYFIINGKERALIAQERLNYNHVYCFTESSSAESAKYPYVAEIRSMSEETAHSVSIHAKINREMSSFVFSLPYVSRDIQALIVFRAIGCTNREIVSYINPITPDEISVVRKLIRQSYQYPTTESAILHISEYIQKVEDDEERKISSAQQIVDNELFPHLGISSAIEKGMMLGEMMIKAIRTGLKTRKTDERDNLSVKRFEGTGVLIIDLIRMGLKRYIDNLIKYLEKIQDIVSALPRVNNIISTNLRSSFSTGNWSGQKTLYTRVGVSQVISRLSFPATLSHLRRIVIPTDREGKNAKIRQIDPTQVFFIDIIESPEGKSIGIVKNLALLSNITTGYNRLLIMDLIEKLPYFSHPKHYHSLLQQEENKRIYKVFVNEIICGILAEANVSKFLSFLQSKKKIGLLDEQVSFICDKDDCEFRIYCDAGRLFRPVFTVDKATKQLLIVKEGSLNQIDRSGQVDLKSLKWSDMVYRGWIRYIDSNEVEYSLIAMKHEDLQTYPQNDYDYCEIHPSLMLGVCSSIIPFPDHNQNPRLVYESSMMKQALGFPSYGINQRFDTVYHSLHYPQKPLVETKYNKMFHYDELLTGCNPIVAITVYGGWSQEDSVMINQSSVDRGMFHHTCYKTVVCEENKKTNSNYHRIEVPHEKVQNGEYNYSKLDEWGVIRKGVPVEKNDVLVGKTNNYGDNSKEQNDVSLIATQGEEGIVDDLWIGLNAEGQRMIKVKIRQVRIPEVGDKFASRSSQKGVCGLLLRQEDMPFCVQSGMVPDLMLNAHSQPSRMTLSQLIETMYGKVCSLDGKIGDGTIFTDKDTNPIEPIAEQLGKLGFERYGNERMCSGYTGEMMDASIFIGPTYYQRLKHLVADKMHCLTLDHEVLTSNGWKFFDQIDREKDRIATLERGELVYRQAMELLYYPDFEGELYHVKNEIVDLTVTMDHKMYVSVYDEERKVWNDTELISAKNLIGKKVKYVNTTKWRTPTMSWKNKKYGIQFNRMWTNVIGDQFREPDHKEVYDYHHPIFSPLEDDEPFPEWVWKLSAHQSSLFLKHVLQSNKASRYTLGGDPQGENFVCHYPTTNRQRIDELVRLTLHVGMYSIQSEDKKELDIVFYCNSITHYGQYPTQTQKSESISYSKQPVFCLEVPGEIFYVRRNGKACWTGNSRARGGVTKLTRQPLDGRKMDGGLRTGEMERDALISHGIASTCRECLFTLSDKYTIDICSKCGCIKSVSNECRVCRTNGDLATINLPYSCKLLIQELGALGVNIAIHTK